MAGGQDSLKKLFKGDNGTVTAFFFFVLVLYFFDFIFRAGLGLGQTAAGGITTVLFICYIIIAMWAAFGVFRAETPKERIQNLGVFIGLSLIATFAPAIANTLYRVVPGLATFFFLNIFLAILSQIWLWYIFFTHGESLGKALYWLFLIYFISLVIATIYATGIMAQLSTIDLYSGKGAGQQQAFIDLYTKAGNSLYIIWAGGEGALQQGASKLNETLSYASGDYYTGQVDRKATIPNKIDIKDLKATQPDFRDIDPVTVFATLTTQTIDTTPPPVCTLGCSAVADNGKDVKVFDTTPAPAQVTLGPYDSWDITCSWKAGTFKLNPPVREARINMSATFDFLTQAYTKTYWMDKARLQELKQSNQDPLTVYSITDKNPPTIYTNGPLKTGMRISSQPVQGLEKAEQDFTLGVTFDNNWDGQVVTLRSITVFVPKGMRIVGVVGQNTPPKQINCNDDAIIASDKDSCDDTLNNIYYLEPQNVDPSKFLTLLFTIKTGPADYDKLLSQAPVTTRFFKTTARYT